MPTISMPQYPPSNLNNANQNDVHQVPTHYDHLVQQSQHAGYGGGFHHNPSIMGKLQKYTMWCHSTAVIIYNISTERFLCVSLIIRHVPKLLGPLWVQWQTYEWRLQVPNRPIIQNINNTATVTATERANGSANIHLIYHNQIIHWPYERCELESNVWASSSLWATKRVQSNATKLCESKC